MQNQCATQIRHCKGRKFWPYVTIFGLSRMVDSYPVYPLLEEGRELAPPVKMHKHDFPGQLYLLAMTRDPLVARPQRSESGRCQRPRAV